MRRLWLVPVTVIALVAGSCSDGGTDGDAADDPVTPAGSMTTQDPMVTGGTGTSSTVDLPGEPIDLYPYEGAALAVVGVERGNTLALRAGPGTDFEVVRGLSPTDTEIIATGHNRRVGDTIWAEVDTAGDHGWADAASLLQLGSSDDITQELVDASGELPAGETMVDVAEAVAELRASTEPPSRVAIIEDPEVGDLGSITVDVIGLGDDALGGERLHILAEPVPQGEAFVVQSVQRLALCSRGVTDDERCV